MIKVEHGNEATPVLSGAACATESLNGKVAVTNEDRRILSDRGTSCKPSLSTPDNPAKYCERPRTVTASTTGVTLGPRQ